MISWFEEHDCLFFGKGKFSLTMIQYILTILTTIRNKI